MRNTSSCIRATKKMTRLGWISSSRWKLTSWSLDLTDSSMNKRKISVKLFRKNDFNKSGSMIRTWYQLLRSKLKLFCKIRELKVFAKKNQLSLCSSFPTKRKNRKNFFHKRVQNFRSDHARWPFEASKVRTEKGRWNCKQKFGGSKGSEKREQGFVSENQKRSIERSQRRPDNWIGRQLIAGCLIASSAIYAAFAKLPSTRTSRKGEESLRRWRLQIKCR